MTINQINSTLAYTQEQLARYLNRIRYWNKYENKQDSIEPKLDTLKRIINGHTSSIPYGNLSFIYYKKLSEPEGNSPCDISDPLTTQGVSIDLQDIFKKLVLEERDGYCLEHNLLCFHMLVTLGFNVYITGSRVVQPNIWDQNQIVELDPMRHICIIVELDGKDYFIDVGLRLGVTSLPVLMEEGLVQQTNPLVEHRFTRAPYPTSTIQNTNPKYHPWILEGKCKQLQNKRYHPRNDWTPLTYNNPAPIYLRDVELFNATIVGNKSQNIFGRCITMTINTEKGYMNLRDQTLRIYSEDGVQVVLLNSEKERREAYYKYLNARVPEDHIEHLPINQ